MKQIYILFLLLTTLGAYSQIELEHTYPDVSIGRTLLEISGEKYYHSTQNETIAQCLIYNADHSLWKTIDLPLPEDANHGVSIWDVTETKINPDNQIEICYRYTRTVDGIVVNESRVINESGSVLLTVEGAGYITLFQLGGYPDKLMANIIESVNMTTLVYSIPDLILEHTYSGYTYWDFVKRINLEISGEKYFILNSEESRVEVYNADHTPWKTINLVATEGANIFSAQVSETIIGDDLLEVIYRTSEVISGEVSYTTFVINENNDVLLTVDDGSGFNYSKEDGLDDKLVVYQNGSSPNAKVYSLPGLTLEHTYSGGGTIKRVNLETLGEKYFHMNPEAENMQAYNTDHTPWISIDPVPGTSINNVSHISESIIHLNDQIEIIYSFGNQAEQSVELVIINQDSEALLSIECGHALSHTLSELPGLQNKFIVVCAEDNMSYFSSVYSLPSFTSVGFTEPTLLEDLTIFPNPSSGQITLDFKNNVPESISIYSIDGKLISEIKSPSANQIDVSFLSSGLYLLVGKEDDQTVFSEKFVVE